MRFRLALTLSLTLMMGCAGGPPRQATPPSQRERDAIRREKFMILGVEDKWHEAPFIIERLKRLGGVLEVEQDQTDGKYVVVFNPQRTHRDMIRKELLAIGKEQGRRWEPVFDDR